MIYIKTNHVCKLLILFILCSHPVHAMEIHAQICSIHPSKKPFFFSCEFILQRRHRQGLRLMWLYLLKGLCITAREQLTAKWKNNQGGQGSRISVNHPTVNNILVYPELLRLMREGRTTLQGADPGTARDLGAASQPGIYTFVCVRVCVCDDRTCLLAVWRKLRRQSLMTNSRMPLR